MELPPAREMRKRLREKSDAEMTKEETAVDLAYKQVVEAFLKEEVQTVFFKDSSCPLFDALRPRLRQAVLGKIAATPGYIVSIQFGQAGARAVPSFVWDWDELWTITRDYFREFSITVNMKEKDE